MQLFFGNEMMIETMWFFIIAGILLLLELFVFSYFLLFIGVGVLISGILNFFGLFNSLALQCFCIVLCSIIALFTLRPLMKRFSKPKDNFVENANLKLEIGTKAKVVANGIIECKGTMWKSDTSKVKLNEEVRIVAFKDGIAVVESLGK